KIATELFDSPQIETSELQMINRLTSDDSYFYGVMLILEDLKEDVTDILLEWWRKYDVLEQKIEEISQKIEVLISSTPEELLRWPLITRLFIVKIAKYSLDEEDFPSIANSALKTI